ncbi:carbohydrate esterase family 4 protein [Gymnopilus junonius]|uniref:Carbohydrate esterase family 4 protein n=1 Tax=Gymnopilus junonius TaxID=109634 RepID=A0A9P5TTV6_GYMJU|nr:carbohydrate esterase family 4 protein [Gymnopilus junonius]
MLAAALLAVYLAVGALASPLQMRQGEARVITSCVEPNTAALTFDDGPWVYLYDVSKALTAANATGTFFFNGNNYACIYDPDSVKRVVYAYQHGHQIGSHTWSHKDLTTLSLDDIHNEMWLVEQALQKIVGVTPAFMRPPYGNYNALVRQVSYIRGQILALWDFDSGDSTGSTPAQSEAAYEELIKKHPSNLLALNHETYETTAHQVLPFAIQKLQAAGYRLVSLAECTGLPAYQGAIGSPGVPDSTWHC